FGVLHFKNTCRCANLTQLANLTTAFSIKWGTVKDNNAFHAFSQALGWIAVLIKRMDDDAVFFKLFVADKGGWVVYLNDTTIIDIEFARITRTFTLCLHVLIEFCFINHNAALTGHISCQVDGEAVSIIKLKRRFTRKSIAVL